MPAALTQSQEDYLEAIHAIAGEGRDVCVRDIAARLGVAMPSVTGAMKRLEGMGLVRHGRYDFIELTAAGKRRAGAIAGRHALLKRFLMEKLCVDEKTADADACAIEHHVSERTVNALMHFMGGNN